MEGGPHAEAGENLPSGTAEVNGVRAAVEPEAVHLGLVHDVAQT